MKPVFDIKGNASQTNIVLCEWGETYCCIAAYDDNVKALHSLQYFTFDQYTDASVGNSIIQHVSSHVTASAKLVFCSAFPEALLIPKKIYKSDLRLLESLFGNSSTEHADQIGEWGLVNTYSFPKPISDRIAAAFPTSFFYHAYTPALKVYNGFEASHQVMVHFAPALMRVIVKKEGNLQLAQTYRYAAPLDAVYYLLKIFEECRLVKDATLILSGLIEEDSALYKELYSFFVNIAFARPIEIPAVADQPAHYFTSLYNLAACVS